MFDGYLARCYSLTCYNSRAVLEATSDGYRMRRKSYCYRLVLVLLLIVVFITGCASWEQGTRPNQSSLTEEEFKSLLTVQDVKHVLVSEVELNTRFYNYKEMAESVDPQQVVAIDSFYGLSFQTGDGMKSMTLAVIDFDSSSSAEQHFQKVKTESELERMQEPIGNDSFVKQLNSDGMGSIIIFLKGDRLVQLHTAMPVGEYPIVDLSGLEELANKVDRKL